MLRVISWSGQVALAIVIVSASVVVFNPAASAQTAASVSGQLIEDRNDDGVRGDDDLGAQTLVELEHLSGGRVDAVYSLFSDAEGRFSFEDVPRGDYNLVIWWEPGFAQPESQADRLDVPVTDAALVAGTTRDQAFLLKPLPDGLVPYPVRSGGEAPPVGSLTIGSNGTSGLPSTGLGSANGSREYTTVIALGVAASVSALVLALAARRRSAAR